MKKVLKSLLLLLLAVPLTASAQSSKSAQTDDDDWDWQGTGWALRNGYIVTNYHVVEGARSFKLKRVVGDTVRQYTAETVATDSEHDLAILHITDAQPGEFNYIPYSIRSEQAEVGESVFVLGFPMTQYLGDEIKLTTGVISARTGYQGDASSYQTTAAIQSGNSGGPMFDEDGNVIAIVNAKFNGGENVGYAVKATHLIPLISQIGSSIQPTGNTMKGKKLPEQVRAAKSYVFTINAYTSGSSSSSSSSYSNIITYPYVDEAPQTDGQLDITRVELTSSATIIDFSYIRDKAGQEYGWVAINPETYLEVDDTKYKMTRVEGIALLPQHTAINDSVDKLTFRLYFPALPTGTTSFSLLETDGWHFYGISTKK